jgi:hypothetical protein
MTFEQYELVGGDPGSYSGGFSFPKNPLITLVDKEASSSNKVSDLFVGLAVPYWAFSQKSECSNNIAVDVDDDKVIDDELYNKLFDSVQYYVGSKKQSRRVKVERKKQTKKNRH